MKDPNEIHPELQRLMAEAAARPMFGRPTPQQQPQRGAPLHFNFGNVQAGASVPCRAHSNRHCRIGMLIGDGAANIATVGELERFEVVSFTIANVRAIRDLPIRVAAFERFIQAGMYPLPVVAAQMDVVIVVHNISQERARLELALGTLSFVE